MLICYVVLAILRSQGGVGVEFFHDLRRRSRCGVKKMRLYPSPVWGHSAHIHLTDPTINDTLRIVTGYLM